MTEQELRELHEPGNPDVTGTYPGEERVQIVAKEGNPRARQEGYPFYRDEMDYDPRFDEEQEDIDGRD